MLFFYFGVLEVYIILYLEKIDISQFFLNRYKYTIFLYLFVCIYYMDKACCTAGGVFSLQVLDHCVELVSTSGSAVPWTPWGPSTDPP